jgi:hypothetical protein
MKKSVYLFSALMFMGTAVPAQNLPVFDEYKGFEMVGVLGHEILIVENGGTTFACWLNDGIEKQAGYQLIDPCYPIVTAKAASAILAAENALIASLETLPIESFASAVKEAMRARNCTINTKVVDERVFRAEVALQVAQLVGHEGGLSANTTEKLADMADQAIEMMIDAGELAIGDDRIVTLANCE